MLKQTNYYYGNVALTKELVDKIAEGVFGKDNFAISARGNNGNSPEIPPSADIKGLELVLKPQDAGGDLPSMVCLYKRGDAEPPYNPDYRVKIEGENGTLNMTDEKIRKLLGLG